MKPTPDNRPQTMAELARHLRLARSTVSMALRNHPDIAPETRRRVQQAADRLGYRANPLVSTLMANVHAAHPMKRDTVLAVVSEDPEPVEWYRRPLLDAIHRGICAQADRCGFLLQQFRLGETGLSPTRLSVVLNARGIPGVILAPVSCTKASRFQAWNEFALVTIGWSIADPRLSRSSFHHFQNMLLAWDTLATRGYERIGFVHTTEQSQRSSLTYLGGFLARSHTRPAHARVQPLAVDIAESMTVELFREWKLRERPDAVIVTDAACFVPIVRQAAAVPAEMAVVALETGPAPAGTAGIDEQSFRVGSAAIDLLIGQLHRNQRGLSEVPCCVHVPGVWREGDTVRPEVLPPIDLRRSA